MKFHKDGTLPDADNSKIMFVFGSNLAGIHGKGAAKAAWNFFSAKGGVGIGPTGRAYAIPTKNRRLETMPLDAIAAHVKNFLEYARRMPAREFFVTRVGCGLAGYTDEVVAPLFEGAPDNCNFAEEWREYLL